MIQVAPGSHSCPVHRSYRGDLQPTFQDWVYALSGKKMGRRTSLKRQIRKMFLSWTSHTTLFLENIPITPQKETMDHSGTNISMILQSFKFTCKSNSHCRNSMIILPIKINCGLLLQGCHSETLLPPRAKYWPIRATLICMSGTKPQKM